METFLEISLMPINIKKLMHIVRKLCICVAVGMLTFLSFMWVNGVFDSFKTGIACSLLFLLVNIPILRPGIVYDKVSQSTVRFLTNQMCFFDKRGRCWRIIDYKEITDVRVEDVSGFFYGENQDRIKNKYVCVFLNGSKDIPKVPYRDLFNEEDFIMFGYNDEAMHWLCQNWSASKK